MARTTVAGTPVLDERGLRAAELLLSLALLVVFLAFDDLPMVDLPQHAAQIAAWLSLDEPTSQLFGRYELNLRTPYLLANALARALSPWFGVIVALKLVVWLAIAGNMLAVGALARRLGHDPWLALLGLVTSTGLCFYFGFISYMLGVAIGVGSIALALDHAAAPSLRRAALLALFTTLTLLTHGVAFALAIALSGLVLLRGAGAIAVRLAPLAVPFTLAGVWFLPGPIAVRIGGDAWEPSFLRWREFPSLLVSFGSSDHFASALGIGLLVTLLVSVGVRPALARERVLVLAALLVGYGLFPAMFRGIALLHTRLPAFLLPVMLLAFRPRVPEAPSLLRRTRAAVALLGLVWLLVFSARLWRFNEETRSFHALVRELPPGLAMRPVIFDRGSPAFPGVPIYLHYSAYYFVEKGGFQGYSFAMYPTSVIRYRPGVTPGMLNAAEWRPEAFDAKSEVPVYDFFLVRSERDRGAELFAHAPEPVVLRKRFGPWWGYEKLGSRTGGASAASASLSPRE
jgi:hypothetical protein